LKKAVVDAGVLRCRVVVGDVVIAVFGSNGARLGSVKLNAGAKVKGEIE